MLADALEGGVESGLVQMTLLTHESEVLLVLMTGAPPLKEQGLPSFFLCLSSMQEPKPASIWWVRGYLRGSGEMRPVLTL